jgi:hypothetical protein
MEAAGLGLWARGKASRTGPVVRQPHPADRAMRAQGWQGLVHPTGAGDEALALRRALCHLATRAQSPDTQGGTLRC